MGRKRSDKQLAVTAGLNGARLRSKKIGKENILPDTSIPLRRSTRAQDYVKTLENRISDQETQILSLAASNSAYQADNHLLHTRLDDSYSRIESLEKDQATTTERLSTAEHDLSIANDTISSQAVIISQKNQRINRLIRDKSVLAAKIAGLKRDVLDAVLRADAANSFTKSHAIRIETLLTTIHHLNRKIDSHRAEKIQIRKTLKSTQMRESRAKSALERTRTALKQKSHSLSTSHRTYTTQYCSLALAFTCAGCAQARIGGLLTRVGEVLGVRLKCSLSRRTVGRVITEAGIKVRLQLGHELARAKGP
jgi:chromosome segregation ATPase